MLRKGILFDVLPHISPYIISANIVNQSDPKIPCLFVYFVSCVLHVHILELSICLLVYDIHNMVSLKLERPLISNTLKKIRYLNLLAPQSDTKRPNSQCKHQRTRVAHFPLFETCKRNNAKGVTRHDDLTTFSIPVPA